MSKAKVLIVGSGGREHALGWKIGQSQHVSKVIYSPGNGGTAEEKGRNISLDSTKKENFQDLLNFIKIEDIDMVVVGPEDPLAYGIVDFFNDRGYNRIFGPSQKASLLESDKFFSRDIMYDLKIPQATSTKCFDTKTAENIIKSASFLDNGVVIKARGLTQGKGVSVCSSREEALIELKKHSEKYGPHVLIAQRLYGEEFSVFGISDGNKVSPLEISLQDHKLHLDGDKGINTGGMGAYGPAPVASSKVVRYVANNIMTPVVRKMNEGGIEYKGFLYAGMIMTKDGPKVIEFNIRFGDPECQPAMMMLKSDLFETLSLSLEGKLDQVKLEFKRGASCCVVLASPGYPESYQKGLPINGLEETSSLDGIKVFHAGTKKENGTILNSGGRVLGVTSYSHSSIKDARIKAYEGVSYLKLGNESFHYRRDIANKALK